MSTTKEDFDPVKARKVIAERPRHQRDQGRTTAACYQLLMQIVSASYPKTYIYVVANYYQGRTALACLQWIGTTYFAGECKVTGCFGRGTLTVERNGQVSSIVIAFANDPTSIRQIMVGYVDAVLVDDLGEWSDFYYRKMPKQIGNFVLGNPTT